MKENILRLKNTVFTYIVQKKETDVNLATI